MLCNLKGGRHVGGARSRAFAVALVSQSRWFPRTHALRAARPRKASHAAATAQIAKRCRRRTRTRPFTLSTIPSLGKIAKRSVESRKRKRRLRLGPCCKDHMPSLAHDHYVSVVRHPRDVPERCRRMMSQHRGSQQTKTVAFERNLSRVEHANRSKPWRFVRGLISRQNEKEARTKVRRQT